MYTTSIASAIEAHQRATASSSRRRRRRPAAPEPLLGNRAVLGILGVLGVAFLASLIVIAVSLV